MGNAPSNGVQPLEMASEVLSQWKDPAPLSSNDTHEHEHHKNNNTNNNDATDGHANNN